MIEKIKFTSIRISEETAMKLNARKSSLAETYEDVIKKLIKEKEDKEK